MNANVVGVELKGNEERRLFYWGVTALIALCKFIFGTDFSATNVALSSIGQTFGIAPAQLSWVVATYSLVYAGFLVLGGKIADEYGRRRYCMAGIFLFGCGTLLASSSTNLPLLIAARGIEGLGSALMIPASFSLINVLLPDGPLRHRAFAIYSATQGIAVILGLGLGGVMTTEFGWRSVYLLNFPLVLVALLLAWKFIPLRANQRTAARLDVGGALLITIGIASVLYALSAMSKYGISSRASLLPLASGVAIFCAFFMLERRLKEPLLPMQLMSYPNFLGANFATIAVLAGTSGLFVLLNLYMQRVLHFSAMKSGLGMLPFAVAVIIAGHLVGQALARIPMRQTIIGGFMIFALGTLMFAAGTRWAPHYGIGLAPAMVVAGLGNTLSAITLMAFTTGAVSTAIQGAATGVMITFQQIGYALGVSVVLPVLNGGINANLALPAAFAWGFLATTAMALVGLLCVLLLTRGNVVIEPVPVRVASQRILRERS